MSWITIITLLLRVANQIMTFVSRKKAMDEGARRQIERELLKLNRIVEDARRIEEGVARMDDAEIDAALERDYRD